LIKRSGIPLALITLLAGCSTTPPPLVSDSAPGRRLDPGQIADAVPKVEPRSRYGNPDSYAVFGKRYEVMDSSYGYREQGIASWYGTKFHGRRTSSGEPYDMYAMTAAHKQLPLPTYVRVTNLRNGRSAVVKVNDRGPFHANRIIDLSYAAATKLGILAEGTGLVEVHTIDPASPSPPPPSQLNAEPDHERSPDLFIQVGAFSSHHNAHRLRQRLEQNLSRTIRIQQTDRDGNKLFRVQVGPLPTVEQVDNLSLQLADLGIQNLHVVIEQPGLKPH